MSDKPIRQPLTRKKKPEADLRQDYRRTIWISLAVSIIAHAAIFGVFPYLDITDYAKAPDPVILQVENVPETRQERRPPPPPRPVVPIATDSPDVPDDATIETTDVNLFDDLAPPPSLAEIMAREVELEDEDEIVEIWKVEEQPVPTKQVVPEYPDIARKAGIEGHVTVNVLVSRQGKVQALGSVVGPEIFHATASAAAAKWEFKPAIQNGKPVRVWVSLPFKFQLR